MMTKLLHESVLLGCCALALLACKKSDSDATAAPSASAAVVAPAAPSASAAADTGFSVPASDPKLESAKDSWIQNKDRAPKKTTLSGVTFRYVGGCGDKKVSGLSGLQLGCADSVQLCAYTQRALLKDDGWDIVKENAKGPDAYKVLAEKDGNQVAVDIDPMLPGKGDMMCTIMIFAGKKK
jgi:hypothetical protein